MAVSPESILGFAMECSEKSDETNYRNAVARAYYASYHCVKNKLINEPACENGSVHVHLISYLENDAGRNESALAGTLHGKAIAYMLKSLKTRRALSDYDLAAEVTKKNALSAIADATRIFKKCEEVF